MKCPNDQTELAPARRDGVEMEACAKCGGMWLTSQELNALEDKAFLLGDEEKGSLVFSTEPSTRACPQCGKPLKTFNYRLYDLQLDLCEEGHGYWLDAEEDKRVLELMRKEQASLERSERAEDKWASHLHRMREGSFLEKILEILRR
jgi:Zn-finger nucleic acid-binding protein